MIEVILASLLCIAGSTQLLDAGDRISIDETREVWQVPKLPEWPVDLPPLYVTPQEATCFAHPTDDVRLLGDGVWFPRKRSDFEGRLITRCYALPRIIGERLKDIRTIEIPALVDAELRRHLAAARARWLRESSGAVQGSFQDWFVGVMVVGAVIVGALLYAGAYAILHDDT